jgi:hypothetical protein
MEEDEEVRQRGNSINDGSRTGGQEKSPPQRASFIRVVFFIVLSSTKLFLPIKIFSGGNCSLVFFAVLFIQFPNK